MTALGPDTVINQGSRTAARVVEGQAVVVVIDAQKLHTLDDVGTRVWELSTGRSLSQIAETICEEYEVDYDRALEDITRFASDMLGAGMLEIVSDR